MLQDLACLALKVWVKDKSRARYGQTPKTVCLLCTAVQSPSCPTTCQPNRTPTPTTTMVKLSLFRIMKQPTPWHHPPQYYPLALAWSHSLLTAPPLRVPRVGFLAPVSAQAPMSPAAPPPPSGRLGVEPLTPAPCQTPGPARARSTLLHPSYAVALAITTAQAARRPYIRLGGSSLEIFAWHPEHSNESQSL